MTKNSPTFPLIRSANMDTRPYVEVLVEDESILALLDSGSCLSILGSPCLDFIERMRLPISAETSLTISTADGQVQNSLGYVMLPVKLQHVTQNLKVSVVPSINHGLILGMDFLKLFGLRINFDSFTYELPLMPSCVVNTIQSADSLTLKQRQDLSEVVNLFKEIGPEDRIGRTHLLTHTIDTGNAKPIRQRQYPLSHAMQKNLNEQIDEMLKLDVIEPTNSPWSSPLWLVDKRDGSHRVCFDGRKLNSVTVPDSYPMPLIDNIVTKVRDATFLSSIDLKNAFYQIPLDEQSKQKTAFAVYGRGLFCFKVLPFGLNNSAQAMCKLMDMVIGPALEPYVFYYLDDIVVASPDFETHLDVLRKLYQRLKDANLTVNFKKCVFCRSALKFLGFIVDERGLRTDPDKVSAILSYPTPKNTTQIRRLVGLIGYYRRFLRNFSTVCSPITDLLKGQKKGQPVSWTPEADSAFQEIKKMLTSTPILASADFNEQFCIICDASDTGVGGVLFQENDGLEHPIAYFSKTLNRCQRKYSTTEKELLAVIYSIEKFRGYVEGTHFKIITDHSSLIWINSMKNPSPRVARWIMKLNQHKFTIVHRKGTSNNVADALSRSFEETAVLNLSSLIPDTWYSGMVQKVKKKPDLFPAFKVENDILYRHVFSKNPLSKEASEWKIVVPSGNRLDVLKMFHDDATGGHFGLYKTLHRVSELYYWPKMRQSVYNYVRRCKICASCKSSNLPQSGLMGKYRDISFPFQLISTDLLGPYPRSKNGNQYLLVVVDWFTKFVLVHPMSKATSRAIVTFLENNVFLIFGAPQIIAADNGPQFTSREFESLVRSYNVQKVWYNARYHPQINHTERVNRVVTTAIRSYIKDNHKTWDQSIHKVAQAIRLAKHEITELSPSFLTFSRNVPIDGSFYGAISERANNKIEMAKRIIDPQHLQQIPYMYEVVEAKLKKAYENSAQRYNLRRREVRFHVGDRVWKKNFVLSKAVDDFSAKLAPKFIPCVVHKVVSQLVYSLKDLQGNVLGNFHVKDIKPDITEESNDDLDQL